MVQVQKPPRNFRGGFFVAPLNSLRRALQSAVAARENTSVFEASLFS